MGLKHTNASIAQFTKKERGPEVLFLWKSLDLFLLCKEGTEETPIFCPGMGGICKTDGLPSRGGGGKILCKEGTEETPTFYPGMGDICKTDDLPSRSGEGKNLCKEGTEETPTFYPGMGDICKTDGLPSRGGGGKCLCKEGTEETPTFCPGVGCSITNLSPGGIPHRSGGRAARAAGTAAGFRRCLPGPYPG